MLREIITWQCAGFLDWYAVREGDEGEEDAPKGWGNTPEAAKQDLIDVEAVIYDTASTHRPERD